MIVLDTHVLIWLVNGDEKIKKSGFLPHINRAVKKNEIFIPAICLWEISMLVSKERITLSGNTLDWIRNASSAPGTSIYPLTPEVAYESTVLPGDFPADPADRMIIATARVLDARLLTFDREIINYAIKGYLKVIKPESY